jgi:hypothetical protein
VKIICNNKDNEKSWKDIYQKIDDQKNNKKSKLNLSREWKKPRCAKNGQSDLWPKRVETTRRKSVLQ